MRKDSSGHPSVPRGLKQTISKSLRDDFAKELREEHRKAGQGQFDIADAMAAFDRIFEVAQPLKG